MVFWSQAWQDEFVANLLNFKKNGFYLDIGSGPPNAQSNSYFFDSELGWKGICIEQNNDYVEMYAKFRTCTFLNEDATKINYKEILDNLKFPKRIDFLSVDIDEGSSKALSKLPFNDYRFSVCVIENDAYRLGDTIRNEELECMTYYGYYCLFPKILVPKGCGLGDGLIFEDWYVDPAAFNMEKLSKISAEKMYPDDVVNLLKTKSEFFIKQK